MLLPLAAVAQETPLPADEAQPTSEVAARPRIGLVLSGGGARGMAHVGVLKALEEARVPIHAIAGTSIGAVVGGLYASGLSASEIENVMTSIDWQDAFSDRPLRKDLSFRRKEDDRRFPVRLPLGLKGGKFLLPKGLIQGQKLNQILRALTLPVSQVERFDNLPIPFRAVAADIETGATVVLDQGDLPTAMRASMAAPGLFAPVEMDGRLLVDGGLVENLPVATARAMQVDMLIVSDVSFPLQMRDSLATPLDVSNQMIAILIRRDTERQLATLTAADLLVEPQLAGMSTFNFRNVTQAILSGEQAGLAAGPRLAALGVSAAEYDAYIARRNAREITRPRIDFVHTDERSQRYAKTIDAALQPFVGKPLDVRKLDQEITELYGLDIFETVDYRLVREDAEQGLTVRARRKSWGPNYVRFGLNLQDDFEGNNSFNAAVRFIVTEVNALQAEWVTDLQVGENPIFRTEFFQPLTYSPQYFIAPVLLFESRNVQLIEDQTTLAEFRVSSAEAELGVGRVFGNWGELRLGLRRGSGESRLRVGDPTLAEEDFDTGEFFTRFRYDELDNLNFPRSGQIFSVEWDAARTALGDDQSSNIVGLDWLAAHSWGRHTLVFWATGGSTLDSEQPAVQDFFQLGGFLNLSGLAPDSIAGPYFGIARLLYYRQIGREGPGFLNVPTYAGISLEVGNTWLESSNVSFQDTRKDASIYLGLDTLLGPLYLGAGYDTEGETAFYLFMGRPF